MKQVPVVLRVAHASPQHKTLDRTTKDASNVRSFEKCAQLQSVPESSRMHLMRTSARVVASAESLHHLPQTALCNCRSCQGRSRTHARGSAQPREIAVALSRSVATFRGR